jgi:hypothetical protein
MKKSEDDIVTWAKKHIGQEGMDVLIDIGTRGVEFAVQFLKNPFEFCAIHQFKAYMGLKPGQTFDKTYVFVYQKGIDAFAVIWIYPDEDMPVFVVPKAALQNLIKRLNFTLIDNEIFLLWLNENKDIIQNAYQKYKNKYEQLCALQQTSDDTYS